MYIELEAEWKEGSSRESCHSQASHELALQAEQMKSIDQLMNGPCCMQVEGVVKVEKLNQ